MTSAPELDIGWSYDNEFHSPSPFPGCTPLRVHRRVPSHGVPRTIVFSDFEGQALEETLNPPDVDVVKMALIMLIENTKYKNEAYLSTVEQTPDGARNSTGRLSELIKLACEALAREADIQSCDLRREHDASALAYRRQRDAQAADLAYCHNLLAPVNNLPVEVFSNVLIFASVGWSPTGLNHNKALRALATVGKYWKEVVFSTPQLWSTLQENMSPKQVNSAIERSRMTPLDTQFEAGGVYRDVWRRRELFIESISPHAQR
ncbi:hypothetical protein FRB95_013937 [Tulasnella sp. JGI-2019a]|nr:hypothetical protein FRB93_005319 [Tulasnella sp. JGI-2019a]KAG9022940.1 hypothetical protein FRB95_013937 [Tulasnella sp. JGI-2019a]